MSFFSRQSGGKGDGSNKKVTLNPFAKPSNNSNSDDAAKNKTGGENEMTSEQQDRAVQDFMKKNGLYEGIDIQKMMQAASSGDEEVFGAQLARMMENSVRVSTVAAERLTRAQVQAAREQAVNEAQSGTRNELAREQLHKDLPFTAEPALAPVADTVLNGFIAQGQSVAEAIKSTGEYFEATAKTAGQHFGMQVETPSGQRPGTRPFSQSRGGQDNNNYSGPGQSDKEDDWVAHLTSGNETFESINQTPGTGDAGDGESTSTGE